MGIKIHSRRLEIQTDLNRKRELTERLVDHMNDLSQVRGTAVVHADAPCRVAKEVASFTRTTIAQKARIYSARSSRRQARV